VRCPFRCVHRHVVVHFGLYFSSVNFSELVDLGSEIVGWAPPAHVFKLHRCLGFETSSEKFSELTTLPCSVKASHGLSRAAWIREMTSGSGPAREIFYFGLL